MKTKDGVGMPRRSTGGSMAYDFFAQDDIVIRKGEWIEFGTGVFFDGSERLILKLSPSGHSTESDDVIAYEVHNWGLMLYPRSGLGFKYKVRLANSVGLADMDYRSEIRCKITADEDIIIPKGVAYMQGVFLPYLTLEDEIQPTEERRGGFGSTDKESSA